MPFDPKTDHEIRRLIGLENSRPGFDEATKYSPVLKEEKERPITQQELRVLSGTGHQYEGFEGKTDAAYEKEKREKTDAAILAAARAIWQVVDPGGSGGSAFQGLVHTIEIKLEKHIHDVIDGLASE